MTRRPENTLLALENALRLGANAIEFDLQLNLDNDFIVIHDDTLLRTAGVRKSVLSNHTSDLQSISVHQPDRYRKTFFPQTIPLLHDVLKLLDKYPQAKAFVEIKEESLTHWGIETVMQQLLTELAPYDRQCILISFSFAAIAYARAQNILPCGWVIKKYQKPYQLQAERLQPQYLICNYHKLPTRGKLWQGTWQWLLYDIKQTKKAQRLAQRGVSHFETGDIETILNGTST